MKKIFKIIGISIAILLGLGLIIGIVFLNFSPQFGKGPTKEQKKQFAKLDNYKDGKFVNQSTTAMEMDIWKLIKEMLASAPNRKPIKDINPQKIDAVGLDNHFYEETRLTWIGHSTFLLQIQGKKILIDPMFGNTPSPHQLLGTERYSEKLPFDLNKLGYVDAVILSHDHYDHLDYNSILILKDKVGEFITPLGVGSHLLSWGVEPCKIVELNWWESIDVGDLKLICTPSRHFSGRGLFDRNPTLWSSWVIKGESVNIFFSGDGGYDTHFKTIGDKYGPFDISMVECGQYNENWSQIHMMPEETAQAAKDLNSRLLLPMHWGAFTLALHDWTDPIERVLLKAQELNVKVTTPRIGEPVQVGNIIYPNQKWWLEYKN